MMGRNTIAKPQWPYTLNTDCAQAQGLVAWYPGDPSDGRSLVDMSGRKNHGTLSNIGNTNTSGWTAGYQGGRCLYLDGVNDAVNLNSQLMPTTTPFTLAAWINTPNVASVGCPFGQTAGGAGRLVWYMNTTLQPQIGGGGGEPFFGTVNFAANKWYHVVLARSGTTYTQWVNGKRDGTGTSPTSSLDVANTWYGSRNASELLWVGFLDSGMIYNRALTDPEAWALYDPATRWQLRYQRQRAYFFSAAAVASGIKFRKTLSGIGTGVGKRQAQGA